MDQKGVQIIRCQACGAANRIPPDKIGLSAKCGKCGGNLQQRAAAGETLKLRCTECGAKNRVPAAKLDGVPRCGKCKSLLKIEDLFTPQPVMVTDGNFDSRVLKSPLPVLLFAWAPWCTTCLAVAPIIDKFAVDSKGKIRVGKLNVDANPMLASKFNILSVPFVYIFDNGQMRESMPGALQEDELRMKMAPYL